MTSTKDNTHLYSILFPAFLLIAMPFTSSAEDFLYAEAINKAGRQRMLTQRITKTYCQIGLKVKAEKSNQQLQEAIDLFSTQLMELKGLATEKDVINAIENIESLWLPFKDEALSAPLQANVQRLVEMDEKLLLANEELVRVLVNHSGNTSTRLVNISGRQRMLSQRLAKFYLLKAWGQGSPAIELEIERARNEFAGALDTLLDAPENTYQTKEKLGKAKLQWTWFSSSLNFSEDEYFPLIVVDTSERLLAIMENITALYQEIVMNDLTAAIE